MTNSNRETRFPIRGGHLDPWELQELTEIAELRAEAERQEVRLEANARRLGRRMAQEATSGSLQRRRLQQSG